MGRSRHVFQLCIFSAIIIGFDLFCWHRIAAQIAAQHYLKVTGEVTLCRKPDPSTNGMSAAAFRFGYRVNGRGYAGNIFSYLEPEPPPRVLDELMPGKEIPVFYNPKNPADAVLSREFTPDDFGKIWQLIFLNAMLFSLLGLWARWRARTVFPAHQLWQS